MSLPTAIFITQLTECLKSAGVRTNREFAVSISAIVFDVAMIKNKYRSEEDSSEMAMAFTNNIIVAIEKFLDEVDTPPSGFFQKPLDNNSQE